MKLLEQLTKKPAAKKHYSGKKKHHTLKTQVSVSSTGRVLDVSKTYPGSVHDKSIADQEQVINSLTPCIAACVLLLKTNAAYNQVFRNIAAIVNFKIENPITTASTKCATP